MELSGAAFFENTLKKKFSSSFSSSKSKQTFQTLNHANLECLKKSLQKPGELGLKPGDFQNMCQIKPKRRVIFAMVLFTLLVVSFVLCCCSLAVMRRILFCYPGRFSTGLSEPMFYENEVGIGLKFPPPHG